MRLWLGAAGAEKLCALGAHRALLCGPSTSPLEVLFGRAWMVCWRLRSDSAPKIPSLSRRNCRRGACRVAPLRKREHSASVASLCRTFRSASTLRAGAR